MDDFESVELSSFTRILIAAPIDSILFPMTVAAKNPFKNELNTSAVLLAPVCAIPPLFRSCCALDIIGIAAVASLFAYARFINSSIHD